ncbi:protein MIZU-KUSSEI 1-like [Gastrolobium bilobum]|uniref:protein MIZU-KUSSEI 1-like n=1 Tax=Gastrolobium bilobum TaxID=150636 RepID=UPI002AB24652|nr:protein MIZU-KUSSEI 1-like [Gastrolobium bilobum]
MAAKSLHDNSFSFSRRYFHLKKKALDEEDELEEIENISLSSHFHMDDEKQKDHHLRIQMEAQLGAVVPMEKKQHSKSKFKSPLTVLNRSRSVHINSSSHFHEDDDEKNEDHHHLRIQMPPELVEKNKFWKSKFKSIITVFSKSRSLHNSGLGTRVVGTLFGYRRGHAHFAFQADPKLSPAFLIELATPTSVLVKEMASGLVRIALECENKAGSTKGVKLLEEPLWKTYCNGRKCGYANKRECGPEEWKILKSVETISMGAGVLPMLGSGNGSGLEGELMYMRAKYERVVGSKDYEAFYMMNPDGSGGPELSIYLLRV